MAKSADKTIKYLRIFWGIFSLGIFSLFMLIVAISNNWFGDMPSWDELENPKSALASEIYSSDEEPVLLGKFYLQNRSNVNFRDISPNMFNALIATEDVRFYSHSGIDFKRLVSIVLFAGKRGGASTITQQLAKNLFGRKKFNNIFDKLLTKAKEWVLAVQIERRYTKEEIITMYLNTVQFEGNAYGIKSAAKVFFNKTPDQLNVQESAVLVGLLKAISKYNPVKNPVASKNRRNTVLEQMVKADYLTEEQCDSLKKTDIKLEYRSEDHNVGLATYFREYLRDYMIDWCEGNGYNLYKDGLKIYSTINSRMQVYAEEAVYKQLSILQAEFNGVYKKTVPWKGHEDVLVRAQHRSDRYISLKQGGSTEAQIKEVFATPVRMKVFSYRGDIDTTMTPMDSIKYYLYFLSSGFMSMDPKTGYIKAWVGGVDHRYFKVDHVNPNTKRQPGSTFKPFTYAFAIDNGVPPCAKIPNQPVVFEEFQNWSPKNADGKVGGEMTLKRGLALSVNLIVANLLKQFGADGPKNVIDLCRRMGVTSELMPYPSLCLGAFDVSVYEMVGAYSTFANKGVWTEPVFLLRIEDKNGNVLQEFPPRKVEALNEEVSYTMLDIMKGCVNGGTGYDIRGKYKITTPIAAKTGTTSSYADGWFMGITPDLVSGAWVGNDERIIRFKDLYHGAGGHQALPIWAYYMQKVYADSKLNVSKGDFERPQDMKIELDCSKYATGDDDNATKEFLINGY